MKQGLLRSNYIDHNKFSLLFLFSGIDECVIVLNISTTVSFFYKEYVKRNFLFTCFLGSELGVINRKQFDSSNDELCRFTTGE